MISYPPTRRILAGRQQDRVIYFLVWKRLQLVLQVNDSDLVVMSPGYGKAVPKMCHLSPDGWFQMALQLTFYRMHRKFVLTYESATTRSVQSQETSSTPTGAKV